MKGASEIQGISSPNGVRLAESTLEKCGGCGLYDINVEKTASRKEMVRSGSDCGSIYNGVIGTRWRGCSGVIGKK